MKRIVAEVVLFTSVLVPAAVTALPVSARADVVAVSLPTAVPIAERTLTFNGTVRLGSTTTGLRTATLWFRYPNALEDTQIGTATSRRPGFLVVTANLDSTRIIPGLNRVWVRDEADGDTRTVLLDLRRRSRVTITHAERRSAGRIWLAVKVSHYDPKLGRFAPSRLSPVKLQERVGGTWVTAGQVTTGTSGLAATLVPAGPGKHEYRAVRPDGASVLTATSRTIRVAGQAQRPEPPTWVVPPAQVNPTEPG
jgi:hypothetical protein